MLTLLSPAPRVNRARRVWPFALALAISTTALEGGIRAEPEHPLGRRSPQLERLFTPPAAPQGTYEVYESSTPIADLAATLRARDPSPRPGAWELRNTGAGDAFGAEGAYDRARLALLLEGRSITTVRGSLRETDGSVTAYTLLSPYPDAELSALRAGTMTIVFHVPRRRR